MIIAGEKDIFIPANRLNKVVREIISNLIAFKTLDMGHFPSGEHLIEINNEIKEFLNTHYEYRVIRVHQIIKLICLFQKRALSGVTKKVQFLNLNAEKLDFFIFTYSAK
ncbi:alpha/beta hydrolase [Peribacillus sp. SIMBA_075]|uniref:hypothetical protein n=1 Tax=Peribacillus sp. SIMBA_075 TaxID=3085813 RepID=UPI00397858A5